MFWARNETSNCPHQKRCPKWQMVRRKRVKVLSNNLSSIGKPWTPEQKHHFGFWYFCRIAKLRRGLSSFLSKTISWQVIESGESTGSKDIVGKRMHTKKVNRRYQLIEQKVYYKDACNFSCITETHAIFPKNRSKYRILCLLHNVFGFSMSIYVDDLK